MVNTIIRKYLFYCLLQERRVSQNWKLLHESLSIINPYMGISVICWFHLSIVHLPNSMLRVYPRGDYTSDKIHGLPLIQISHRGSFALTCRLSGDASGLSCNLVWVATVTKPYHYQVDLCNQQLHVSLHLRTNRQFIILIIRKIKLLIS